jgi:hypothetical protein
VKLFVMTSTHHGGFESTDIVYRADDGPIVKVVKSLTETPALLEFMIELVPTVACGSIVEFCSKPNTFTDAHTKGWLVRWRRDQFTKKPDKHPELWKQFDGLIEKRQIQLAFPFTSEANLKSVLSPQHPDPPGTPTENPWAKPESRDEMLQHALDGRDNSGKK